jgi:hypothetical protein
MWGTPVFAALGRLGDIYNGAKSAGTLPEVFWRRVRCVFGVRSVLKQPKVDLGDI